MEVLLLWAAALASIYLDLRLHAHQLSHHANVLFVLALRLLLDLGVDLRQVLDARHC